jgi:hypothetical protein
MLVRWKVHRVEDFKTLGEWWSKKVERAWVTE